MFFFVCLFFHFKLSCESSSLRQKHLKEQNVPTPVYTHRHPKSYHLAKFKNISFHSAFCRYTRKFPIICTSMQLWISFNQCNHDIPC